MKKFAALAAALLVGSALSASADTTTFDFENVTPTNDTGAYTSISQTVNGITMTVTRVGGNSFDTYDLSGQIPGADNWGSSTLSPFFDTSNSAFIFSFSATVSSFSVQVGDFDEDSDSETFSAYSSTGGAGSLLASGTGTWGDGDISVDTPATDSISAAGIESVIFIGGSSDFPNSLFYDNVMVTTAATSPTPEPGSLLLMLTGVGSLVGMRLRRRL